MNLILSESFPLPCLFLVTLASTLGILSSPCSTWHCIMIMCILSCSLRNSVSLTLWVIVTAKVLL